MHTYIHIFMRRADLVSISNFPIFSPTLALRMNISDKKKYQVLSSLNLFPSELRLANAEISRNMHFSRFDSRQFFL